MLADRFTNAPLPQLVLEVAELSNSTAASCHSAAVSWRSAATSWRYRIFCSLSFVLFLTTSAFSSEYLGILAELTKSESPIAAELQLTEEQLTQLKQLVNRRSSAAVGLAAALKDTPKSEHSSIMADFSAESERMAYELLNPAQSVQLARLRIQWLGLISLAEDEISAQVNLADWQKDIIAGWREKVRAARRANEEDQVRPLAESAIRQELSDSQFHAWQVMAGILEESPSGTPEPPIRESADSPATELTSELAESKAVSVGQNSTVELQSLEELRLDLNFQKMPWSDVIRWLADQAELSVHSDLVPPGTFTYRDENCTITEALDIMNASLLDSGFALYRQDRFLRCINFEEDQDKRAELIQVLTDTVTEEELASRGRYEPVRVMFDLDRLNPDDIIDEVVDLLSIQGSAISLVSSGQILVTDMAGNVRNVAEFIRRSEDPSSARGATVQTMPLKSISAEEVLLVARPLLELEADSNISEGIKISTNTFGTVIYARGDMDKIQILRDLVLQMDRPPEGVESPVAFEAPYVGRHLIRGMDLELAYQVASQLLAGSPDIRLAKDETAKQLVLMGRKQDHQLLKETLDNLAGEASDFKVIPLQNLDPVSAVAAVKKFFNLPDKPDPASNDPVVDGDASARQIWVKGSATQVRQIEDLIAKLESNAKTSRSIWGDRLRVIPMNGSGTADALKQAEMLWQQVYGDRNPIVNQTGFANSNGLKTKTLAPDKDPRPTRDSRSNGNRSLDERSFDVTPESDSGDEKAVEDTTGGPEDGVDHNQGRDVQAGHRPTVGSGQTKYAASKYASQNRPAKFVSSWQETDKESTKDIDDAEADGRPERQVSAQSGQAKEGAPIVIQEGPNGIMISSDDPEVLERFDNLLRMILEQSSIGELEPEVIYLQNIKATVAKQLLTEILSGTASSGNSGGLIGDMASGIISGLGGGMFGSLLGGGSGNSSSTISASGMAIGQYSIVADPRLNVLFVKASPPDMKLIEQILRIIDQVEGPFNVDVQGVLELIPVVTQDVNDVLATVRSIFGDRIDGGGGAPQPAGGQNNPAEFFQAMRSAFGGRGGQGSQPAQRSDMLEPRMSIGADTFSNTLVVMGQPYQIAEVRRLVEMIDQAGESEQEEVVVVDMGALSSPALNAGLQRVLGPQAITNTTSSSGPSSSSTASGTSSRGQGNQSSDADSARRRAEFFQRMMQGQGGGNSGFGGNRNSRGGNTNQRSGGGGRNR